jgi:hypothetical protein
MSCARCQDVGWVCEGHPDRTWDKTKPNGCECGAGKPCPVCNASEGKHDQPRTGGAITNITATRSKGKMIGGGMDWHPRPKDDAWREAHLAMLARLGKDAWLRCDECAHIVMVKPRELAERHRPDMLTLLLTIRRWAALAVGSEGWLSAGAARHAPYCQFSFAGRREPSTDSAMRS